MKLHVGSGSVYLDGWVNVDLPSPTTFLANDRPELIEEFITTESDYYGRHWDKDAAALRSGPRNQITVCDRYGSFSFLPVQPHKAEEILSRQVFEHLDRQEAAAALNQCSRALFVGGILRIDIPDADETMRRFHATGDDFYIRHLFGPRKDLYGFHTHYSRQMLIELAKQHGFEFTAEEENIHFYPAFCLRFCKQ